MADAISPDDWARLVDAAAQVDPVPADVTALAQAALQLTADVARAETIFDSWRDAAVAVRSGGGSRVVEFADDDVTLEIEIDPRLRPVASGTVRPAVGTHVLVETPTRESATVAVAEDGGFEIDEFPAGPVRLVLVAGARRLLVTPWEVLAPRG